MEKLYSTLFKDMGLEQFNLIIDFKTPEGIDRFIVTSAIGHCTEADAVRGAIEHLQAEGNEVQCVVRVFGEHSTDELTALAQSFKGMASAEWKYVYLKEQSCSV